MFRKDKVDRVVTSLKATFQLINNENTNINKQYTSKLTLTKLSESIKQTYQILYGTIDKDPKQEYICKLIPKLINSNDNLFYKLSLYRTYFSYETQIHISKILKFIIENGTKYGNFGVSKYIKTQCNPNTKHNKIIDALINNFEQHSGGIFSVLQEMTKRSDLASMFLKLKVKSPAINIEKQIQYNKKSYSTRRKSCSYASKTYTNQSKHYKNNKSNSSDPMNLKHWRPTQITQQETECKSNSVNDVSFVKALFILIKCPSLHISLDAFNTLKCLLNYTKRDQSEKLNEYFAIDNNCNFLFHELNALINSENTIYKSKCFALLKNILTNEDNFDMLLKYITCKDNLLISKRILTDEFIINQNDANNHNTIIDVLLEDYFEHAGHILMELASRSSLADLLLNNIYISRLQGEYDEKSQKSIYSDFKEDEDVISPKISKKNLSRYFGVNSQIMLPHMDSVASNHSCKSEECSIMSPGGTVRNRYSGEDMPCFRRSPFNSVHFSARCSDEGVIARSFVMELICLINRSCSDIVATYSFNVLKLLLTVNKQYASKYLEENYKDLIKKFRQLITVENENEMRQKQFLGLLKDLLRERENLKFRKLFISECIHLKIIMNLLKCKSDAIKEYAFYIFAIFVCSNVKNREIHVILWRNRQQNNLIEFIGNLLQNRNLNEQKKIVIEELKKLPTPRSDKSYKRIPMESLLI